MLYHCGLLDERPANSRTLNWIRRTKWEHLPPEIEHELRVWLAMPGMSVSYHAHVLRLDRRLINRYVGGYDRYKADVIANWMSATRDDCVKLAQMRPGIGDVPLISQIRAVEDLTTMRRVDVAQDYGIAGHTLDMWRKRGFRVGGRVPPGFELLVRR